MSVYRTIGPLVSYVNNKDADHLMHFLDLGNTQIIFLNT